MSLFKAWWHRLLHDPEPCNPLLERRLDAIPLPAHLDELTLAYDWDAAEAEMRSKR
jgi:hypothetical protein